MRKNVILSVIAMVTVLLSGCSTSSPSVRTEVVKPVNDVRTAYDFRLSDLSGKQHSLADYRGKKVYIEYWASWCPVCLGGIDEFEKLSTTNAKSGSVVVLSMVPAGAYGEKSSAEFIRWFKERGYTFPVLLDEGGQVARKFGVRAFPTSIFINSDGVLISATPGQQSNESIEAKIGAIK